MKKSIEKKSILIPGSGGREHALFWKLYQERQEKSSRVGDLYATQINAGIAQLIADNLDIPLKTQDDVQRVVEMVSKKKIDITIVTRDDDLELGLVDALEAAGHKVFGPTRKAAQIEWDKMFTKELMVRNKIPTAPYVAFDDYTKALAEVLRRKDYPLVIKASRLAHGHGVHVPENVGEAEMALNMILRSKAHGAHQTHAIIEKHLKGTEFSGQVWSDGEHWQAMPHTVDYKRLLDGNKGFMTGGMGCYGPAYNRRILLNRRFRKTIVDTALRAMRIRGRAFRGILYPGVIITRSGLKVLEYNARFGDPEAQVLMRLLKSSLLDIVEACLNRTLHKMRIEWHKKYAVCFVLANLGYPQSDGYPKSVITGLDEAALIPGVEVFHAGTVVEDGKIMAVGGRVVGVTAIGDTLEDARELGHDVIAYQIDIPKKQYRSDIAKGV